MLPEEDHRRAKPLSPEHLEERHSKRNWIKNPRIPQAPCRSSQKLQTQLRPRHPGTTRNPVSNCLCYANPSLLPLAWDSFVSLYSGLVGSFTRKTYFKYAYMIEQLNRGFVFNTVSHLRSFMIIRTAAPISLVPERRGVWIMTAAWSRVSLSASFFIPFRFSFLVRDWVVFCTIMFSC